MFSILKRKREYKVKDNLSRQEREELQAIQSDKTLVIQKADKGGSLVILNCEAYDKEIRSQLSNSKFYRKLDHSPISSVKKHTHCLLNQLLDKGCMSKQEYEFMKVDHPVTPVLYTLPKIHKSFQDTPLLPTCCGGHWIHHGKDLGLHGSRSTTPGHGFTYLHT